MSSQCVISPTVGRPSDDQSSPLTVSPPSDDDEEVTETKIVGVTESGVIRKRSFKRKLTKEEKSKRKFGHDTAEYEKIMTKVMADRFISSALEGLQERWKMLTLMHADCLDMLAQWESRRQERIKADRTKRNYDAVKVLVLISVVAFMIGWLIKCCVW